MISVSHGKSLFQGGDDRGDLRNLRTLYEEKN